MCHLSLPSARRGDRPSSATPWASGFLGELAVVLLQGLGGGLRFGLAADDLLEGGPGGVGEGGGGVVEVGQQGALGGDGVEGLVDVLVDPGSGCELGGVVDGHAAGL